MKIAQKSPERFPSESDKRDLRAAVVCDHADAAVVSVENKGSYSRRVRHCPSCQCRITDFSPPTSLDERNA